MRAVIFDWDLTLWNSWDIHLRLMERTGFDLGITPPGAEAVAAEFHRPFHQHLLWFFGSAPNSQGELDTILSAYLRHYHAIVGHRNYLYPGVASLLGALRRRGIRIGILSDKIPEFGEAELRQSGLADLVEYTSFKTDRRPFKPDPTGLFHVLEGLGVEAADTMYVGDAPQDIACARDAGVRSAAAMWATIDADAIIAQQPAHRLHRPHQVMAVVAEINDYDGGFGGSNPWLRHLPWPWRPDADDPLGDQDAAVAASETPTNTEPDASWQYWPLAARWRGRTGELALPADVANPVAPLSLNNADNRFMR